MGWTHPFISGPMWTMTASVGTITQGGRVHNADDNIVFSLTGETPFHG
jgi:hypothetical protein